MAEVEMQHNEDQHRYEARIDGELAGFARYRLDHEAITIVHTEVDDRFEGAGVGSTIARFALDDVRERGSHRLVLECPFVSDWIEKHPEYSDLLEDR